MRNLACYTGRMKHLLTLAVVLFATSSFAAEPSANWSKFRGPGNRGVSSNPNLPTRWSATENVEWKITIPGRGWSSPIVWNGRVFLTTVVNDGKSEFPKKGLYFGGNRLKPPKSVHHWQILCLELKSGKVVWSKEVHAGKPDSSIHIKNSFASETPVTDGERVYFYFGNQGLYCYTLEGKLVWSKPMETRKTRYGWGTAASPVVHKDRLYVINDNEEQSYLLALNKLTGKEVWRVKRKEKSNWSTPYVWVNKERTEIVTPGTGKIRSYDLNGKLLWSLSGMSSITIATPYEHNGLLYVSSGYVLSQLKPIYAIRPGATGDITLAGGKKKNDYIVWSDFRAAPYNPSTIIYQDQLYVLYDFGFLGAYDAASGKPSYRKSRLPNGRAFTASPWAYGGKIFSVNEDGVTFVVEAGKKFKLLHTNRLAEDDMCMATPAIAGDRLLIRTRKRLYCIRNK